jgi:hypothetical protein
LLHAERHEAYAHLKPGQKGTKLRKNMSLKSLRKEIIALRLGKRRLCVRSPNGQIFGVRVTSLSSPNAWIIPAAEEQDCYYVLVFKPEVKPPEFCILNAEQMKKEKETHFKSRRKQIKEYSNPELEEKGLSFRQPFSDDYRNNWGALPK